MPQFFGERPIVDPPLVVPATHRRLVEDEVETENQELEMRLHGLTNRRTCHDHLNDDAAITVSGASMYGAIDASRCAMPKRSASPSAQAK